MEKKLIKAVVPTVVLGYAQYEAFELFGSSMFTQKHCTPEEVVTKCEWQLTRCKRWVENLEALKVEAGKLITDNQPE